MSALRADSIRDGLLVKTEKPNKGRHPTLLRHASYVRCAGAQVMLAVTELRAAGHDLLLKLHSCDQADNGLALVFIGRGVAHIMHVDV